MPLPLPQNVRAQAENPGPGVAFTIELDGRLRGCLVTNEALDDMYGKHDDDAARVGRVQRHSEISRLVAAILRRTDDDAEPIVMTSAMIDWI